MTGKKKKKEKKKQLTNLTILLFINSDDADVICVDAVVGKMSECKSSSNEKEEEEEGREETNIMSKQNTRVDNNNVFPQNIM